MNDNNCSIGYTKTLKGLQPLRVFYSVYLRNILIILSMNPL